MTWLGRPWYDALLLAYIVFVFLLMTFRLRRESSLGWSMASFCVAMAALFSFALLNPPIPSAPSSNLTPVATALRAVVAIMMTWVSLELNHLPPGEVTRVLRR